MKSFPTWLALVLFWFNSGLTIANEPVPPNIILIFIDDMGYGDLGSFGQTKYSTPNLDQLAKEGRRFTNFLVSSAVCSASRAALLTGCYHERIGIRGALNHRSNLGISASETTLAEICKSKGYQTACFGKWHLGHHPKFLPTHHGFDQYLGLPYSNDMWPGTLADRAKQAEAEWKYPRLPLIEQTSVIDPDVVDQDQALLTKHYTEHAVNFMKSNKDSPFFLYLPHAMVHVPLYASEDFHDRTGQGLYADVVAELDWSVGLLRKTLAELKLDEQTLILFTSDNGPWLSYGDHAGTAGTLREGKGTSFEGGIRVPMIACWPKKIPANTTTNTLASTVDILPTIAQMIQAELGPHPIDGQSLVEVMTGQENLPTSHQSIPVYYANGELQAIRTQDFKLMFPHQYRSLPKDEAGYGVGAQQGKPASYQTARLERAELYDLRTDTSESTDVSAKYPEQVERLNSFAEKWRSELGDSLTQRVGTGVREPGRLEPSDARLQW